MNEQRIRRIMSGEARSRGDKAMRAGLRALEPGYRTAVAIRNAMFDHAIRKPARLGRATISVGNITTGGTGKTPMVIELVDRLVRMGERPAVLLRGYMPRGVQGPKQSDEATLYHEALKDTAVVQANANRRLGAARVLGDHPDVSVFILDDGYQHRQVHRDLDLVLVDATNPWGYGHLLPRGMLREPTKNLHRADQIILTRCEQVNKAALSTIDAQVQDLAGKAPLARATSAWTGFRTFNPVTGETLDKPPDELSNLRVAGMCGVGNPDAFFAMLDQAAGKVVIRTSLGDHQQYDRAQLQAWLAEARKAGAEAVATTEKDFVKWLPLLGPQGSPAVDSHASAGLLIHRPNLALRFADGDDQAIDRILRQALGRDHA